MYCSLLLLGFWNPKHANCLGAVILLLLLWEKAFKRAWFIDKRCNSSLSGSVSARTTPLSDSVLSICPTYTEERRRSFMGRTEDQIPFGGRSPVRRTVTILLRVNSSHGSQKCQAKASRGCSAVEEKETYTDPQFNVALNEYCYTYLTVIF